MQKHFIRNALNTPKELVFLTLAVCLSSPASALDFTLNPGGVGLGGPSISTDALIAGEVSNITITDQNYDFQENGYGLITGAQFNGSTLSGTGLAYTLDGPTTTSQTGSYSLYFQFSDTGNAASGQIFSGSFSFYAVSGQSTFSINYANVAQDVNNGTAIYLGTATANSGTVNTSLEGLSANITSATFAPTAAGATFLGLSDPNYVISASFSHSFATSPSQDGVFQTATGYNIYGGYDTINFNPTSPVPELQEWLMLIIGLPCITWMAKRKQTAHFSGSFPGGKHAILG